MSLLDYFSSLDYASDERLEPERAPAPISRAPTEIGIAISRPLPADPLQALQVFCFSHNGPKTLVKFAEDPVFSAVPWLKKKE